MSEKQKKSDLQSAGKFQIIHKKLSETIIIEKCFSYTYYII